MADPKEVTRRVFDDVWNNHHLEAVDELLADDYVHHDPQMPMPVEGVEAYKQFVRYYLKAFPDLHFTIEDEITDGETVVSRWTATGTHRGDLAGIPATGRHFSVTGVTLGRVAGGKFTETWNNWDALGLMQQLGVVATGAKAA